MADKLPKAKELRAIPDAEIRAQLTKLQQELWQYRVKTREGSQQQSHLISAVRHQIARIHTILRERT